MPRKIPYRHGFFFLLKIVRTTLSGGQNSTTNLDFRANISTFKTRNAPKKCPYEGENNAYRTLGLSLNIFQKAKKARFLTSNNIKNTKMDIKRDIKLTFSFDFNYKRVILIYNCPKQF